MKNLFKLLCIALLSLTIVGCGKEEPVETIRVEKVKEIGELATMKYYFHNVTKSKEEFDNSWFEFWKKSELNFWMEYDTVFELGFDLKDLDMNIRGNVVEIVVPEVEILDKYVLTDTFNDNSFYYSKDSAVATAEQQQKALNDAFNQTASEILLDEVIISQVVGNFKDVIGNYVSKVNEASGSNYEIKWIDSVITDKAE